MRAFWIALIGGMIALSFVVSVLAYGLAGLSAILN